MLLPSHVNGMSLDSGGLVNYKILFGNIKKYIILFSVFRDYILNDYILPSAFKLVTA